MPDIYLHLDGEQKGPYQPDQVRQLVTEGKASAQTPAWAPGLGDWSNVHLVLAAFPSVNALPEFRAPVAPPPPALVKQGMSGWVIAIIVGAACFFALFVVSCLAGIALGPITNGIKKAKESMSMQEARQISVAMNAYAADHNGVYPSGVTSTEVFQKLIDEKYILDPAVFYLAQPGKTKATSTKLTADNVCYDVTGGVTSDSPNDLPIVFATGYIITYSSNSIANPDPAGQSAFPGIAVGYKDQSARFLNARPDGTVPGVISPSFDPGTKNYQQLKP